MSSLAPFSRYLGSLLFNSRFDGPTAASFVVGCAVTCVVGSGGGAASSIRTEWMKPGSSFASRVEMKVSYVAGVSLAASFRMRHARFRQSRLNFSAVA